MAALRTKIPIRDGSIDIKREHVEYFLETLDDRDMAKQLTLQRLDDLNVIEKYYVLISVWKLNRAR